MQSEVHHACHTGQNNSMNNIGPNHHFRGETVEQQHKHHDDAAGADGSHTDQKAGAEPNQNHADGGF